MPPSDPDGLELARRRVSSKVKAARRWVRANVLGHKPSEFERWFADRGDDTLRLDYPLTSESVVLDLGGYAGDFTAAMVDRYDCTVHLFEPWSKYFKACTARFAGSHKVHCHPYGLADRDALLPLADLDDGASVVTERQAAASAVETVQIKAMAPVIDALGIDRIDLLKINIEGSEFDVLPHVIATGLVNRIDNIQVQFHAFVEDAESRREAIRHDLSKTHRCTWNYTFVWENWERLT